MTTATSIATVRESHDDYSGMLDPIRAAIASLEGPIFTTNAEGLWAAWLGGLPAEERQHHTCHSCRRFIEAYGGLVSITPSGKTIPLFPVTPGLYLASSLAVLDRVLSARVTGVFVTSEKTWGTPQTRDGKRAGHTWFHMAGSPPSKLVWTNKLKTAHQRSAELTEDYATLIRALVEYKLETFQTALSIASADALYRGEKIEGRLRWLVDLKIVRTMTGPTRDNLTWLAVAQAPAGFCHVCSSVVGSLLDDIEAGNSFEAVKRSFDAKMHPLKYQRPTAPPSAGNIKQAEETVEKLGIAPSLRRRFARLEDIINRAIWVPGPELLTKSEGVFGHLLKSQRMETIITRAPTMTWDKFARTVLPTAELIRVETSSSRSYTALVTAADPEAPPIIQWDLPDYVWGRNPVTWYCYSGGSHPSAWNLPTGLVEATAIVPAPNQWQPGFAHHGEGVLLILKGCRDVNDAGLCLFPEFLKSDLHGIRSTVEEFSRRGKLEDRLEASACGIFIRGGSGVRLQVTSGSGKQITQYVIDRWD